MTSSERYHAIDHLRATMISIVMFGHAMLPYVTFPRSFKDSHTHVAFDFIGIFLYSFAMPVFFVTAGFSTALILERKGARGLAHNRLHRIFVPLIVAYFLLTPLTRIAYKFAKGAASTGSLQAGIDAVQLADWVHWGKAYHLWFLVSLLLYSGIAMLLRQGMLHFARGGADGLLLAGRRLLASRWRAVYLALAAAAAMTPAYVMHGSDATTLPMQLALLGFFLLGWLLYRNADLLPALRQGTWQSFAISAAALPLAVWSTREGLMQPDDLTATVGLVAGLSNGVLAAGMTFGLLGVYQSQFNSPSAIGRYVSDASYWVFLIHFPLVIAVGGLVAVTDYPPFVKYLLTLLIAVPIVVASYHYGVRSTRFGRTLQAKRKAPSGREP